ncbi:helix-turn-helix transcriptional regulator [Pseudomonas putida]|uniref:helix-turn-helix transcriptional regulator n=1 Tax=Pseudomonas putida TaxID=303 RepID=UPI000EF69FF7|nr:helix-turn-helix transcriptional regulator [Pseudomonas putida]AYN13504.1 hypothetical protein CHN49_10325 [Pseudomonas putida]
MSNMDKLYDDLVGLCYESVLDAAAWTTLLSRLAEATGRQQGALLLWEQKHKAGEVSRFYQLEQRAVEDYNNYYCNIDPTRSFMQDRSVGLWYHDYQELGADRIRRDPYYQEYKAQYGMKSVSAIKIHKDSTSEAFLSLVTNRGNHGPNIQQELLLNRLTPHLIRASEISFRLGRLELEIKKRDFLLDRHPTPLWLLDGDSYVVYANHAAIRQVSQNKFELYERFGRLHAHHMDARLQHHIQKAFGKTGSKQASRLRLSPNGKDLLVAPVDTDTPLNQYSSRPLVLIAYLSGQLQGDLLAGIFQFSPAEQRLAELLCLGHTPETCASLLNVSINTVRTQLRALFRKTETERQPELVGLLTRMKV